MGLFSGISNLVSNPLNLAALAMGPAGWASLAVRQLASAVGQQIIQQLGEKLGLPQQMIDLAQAAYASSVGDKAGARQNLREATGRFGDQFNLNPMQRGDLERTVNRAVQDGVREAWDSAERSGLAAGRSSAKGGSWLRALAEQLGRAVDRKQKEMETLAEKADKSRDNTTDYQVAVQEFNLLMSTLTSTIKTIGEALSALAKRQ